MGRLILVLGGARSGKSSFAQTLAERLGERVCYIVTAQPLDEEMRERIRAHQQSRPRQWQTIEAPTRVADALRQAATLAEVVVLDCVTVLVANILAKDESLSSISREVGAFLHLLKESTITVIAVSNEVGMGVVPPYPLGRHFRDALGWTNQCLAQAAEEVYLMIAGIAVELKQSGLGRFICGMASEK